MASAYVRGGFGLGGSCGGRAPGGGVTALGSVKTRVFVSGEWPSTLGVAPTLGSGAEGAGCTAGGRALSCVGVVVMAVENMRANCSRAVRWLSLMGESGDAGAGWRRACVRAAAASMAASVVDNAGMLTCWGNHSTVSEMRAVAVSQIHTR